MSQKSGTNKPTMNMIQWPFRSDAKRDQKQEIDDPEDPSHCVSPR
jgi:hypothetical protein